MVEHSMKRPSNVSILKLCAPPVARIGFMQQPDSQRNCLLLLAIECTSLPSSVPNMDQPLLCYGYNKPNLSLILGF